MSDNNSLPLYTLYQSLVRDNYDVPDNYDSFERTLTAPGREGMESRRALYNSLAADNYDVPDTYESFANTLFAPKETGGYPTPASGAEDAEAVAPEEQKSWQPTLQQRLATAQALNGGMASFRAAAAAGRERTHRAMERNTSQGRRQAQAAEMQAQMAGLPTQALGIGAAAPKGEIGSDAPSTQPRGVTGKAAEVSRRAMERAADREVRSLSGPVVRGMVPGPDGKPVTQWELPDGTLTTDFAEADRAAASSRRNRLAHEFTRRMEENGLDPAKPEDVELQAQYDAQAPAYDAVAELWQEAEEKHKADKERNAKKHWDSYAAMGGGREMRIVTTSMNRYDDNISHMTRFDLQKMMDNAWNRVGSKITTDCYNRLRQQYPGASEEELQATASQMARQLTDNAVYQYAVQQNTPKSTLEYFGRTVADMNVINSISKGLARSQAGTSGDLAAYEAAMGEYGKNHRVAQIAGTVTGMAVDPVTWVSGGVGSLAGKGAINIGGRIVAGRAATSMSTQVGSRIFSSSLTGRIITGAAAGGGNFATYEMLKEAESQFLHGGHINPKTGENEGYSAGAMLSAGGHGLVLGSVTGTLSPMIGNVADKTVKATASTAGKAGVRLGEVAVSTLAEGTIFSVPEWINGDADAMDVWTDNMAMMLGFKAQHGLKSAPRVIASLRPVKPSNGRPLTQAERNHNRMDFEERLRRILDASPSDLSFTSDEREELRRAGYGELADLFSRDRVQDVQRPDIDPAEGAIELRAERVEAETISRNPEFDGYSSMEELMQDGRVSQSARAKAYYILTGRRLPMASVTGYTTNTDADGRVTVNSIAANGEVVTSRTFKNEQEAKQETDNIMRQAELNSVDVGERYKEAVADDMVLDAAISEVSPGADPATIKRIYRAVKAGNKDVTESQKQLVEFLDDAMERNRDIADRYRPEAIREALKEETGIDVDAALRKMPSKRTEAEQAVVKSYLERLFPEEARQQTAEPTAEQAEAQSQYEQGRELFGRFEEGDPTVQADVDAIALRMQEAYQAVEDAFGSEAEYYMFHLNENPWSLVNDPELTVEQKDAVLYYINAKAALDGVMDASNEVADRKRAEVEESVAKRTHKDNGVIIPATMKVDDRPVYIVKGDVVMFPDGSAVDVRNSSESVVVMDAQTGEYQFTSPDQIFQVSEAVNPQDELDTALSVIEQEQMNIFGDNAVAPEESAEGEEPQQDEIDPFAQPAEAEAPATADTSEYDRGYEQGLEEAAKADDAWIANLIKIYSQNTPESMSETMKGQLDAYIYEQQRRAQAVPKNAESVPNPAENPVADAETAPETVPNAENGQQTALSRIPLNEKGEPSFEAVDKETAWDGLVEAVGGEVDAADIALAQVQQATADLEALHKKPPTMRSPKLKGSPMAMAEAKRKAAEQYRNDLAQYNQQIADTQARHDAWNGIVGVYNSRNAVLRRLQEEERRQRDAIAHDEAVARFEEAQRIKAEKQTEQERIGVHAVNPKIKEKWDAAPKVEGNEDALTLPDGSTISGRYILTEAGAASPSHDANNGYVPTEGFPIDKNGQSVNDRDYMRDKDAQQKVEGMADNYDNRALQDPVIVSKDGVVLSGNNRTMSGDLAARRGTDTAYINYLANFGHKKYGFTQEQVTGMRNPRVVFVPDEALPYNATTFARFNAQEKKSQGKPEAAVKLGKIVPDNVFNNIVNDISRYDRLSDYYADEKAVAQALGALMQAKVINDMQMPELRTGTALSATGKELIENTLIGKVFQTSPDAVRQIISVPTLRQSIVMGLSEIANNRTLAKNGYDISEELAKAVDLVTRAKNAMPDVYTPGIPVSPFGRQQGLFDDEFGDSRVTDATILLIADLLNDTKPSRLRNVLTLYNKEAGNSASGSMDLFTGEVPSKENILTEINNHFINATPKEQQAIVDAAIAERRAAAEEATAVITTEGRQGAEQIPDAGQRSERNQGNSLGEIRDRSIDDFFGPVYTKFQGKGNEAEAYLREMCEGVAKGALTYPGITPIDLAWGDNKAGYMKIVIKHPEVVGRLQELIDQCKITNKSENRIILESDTHKFIVSKMKGSIPTDNWLLTAYHKKEKSVSASSSDIETEPGGKRNGTATPLNGLSFDGKGNTLPSEKQGEDAKSFDVEVNTEPTEAQKAAGNYKMEHRRVDGYNISIENPKGSVRRGTGADGKPWETVMQNDYGYIHGTEGVDGDHIDVFLSDTPEEGDVFVVDQVNEDGSFDEHKVMYGFSTEQAARDAYLSNYEPGWTGLGAITHVSKEEFKKWIGSSRRKTKPFADYVSVKKEVSASSQGSVADYKSVKPIEENGMIGRSLSEQEATELITRMEANAEVAPEMELTIENWDAQFGEDGIVNTPVGDVKMGEHQFLKMMRQGRNSKLGMEKPTLEQPYVIVEVGSEAIEGDSADRDSSYIFTRAFIKSDGSRFYYFTSITVSKDGKEVVVSNQEKSRNRILRLLKEGSVVWRTPKDATTPSAEEQGLDYEQPTLAETAAKGSGITPQSTSSDGKGNTLSADKQTESTESSLGLDKAKRVRELSAKLNTPVRIITDANEIDNLPSVRHRRAKGWWSAKDGEIVVVLPNNVNVSDVENTVVHEVVGHYGLRAFIGEERFDEFLGEVYDHASNPIRKVIDKKTDDMVNAEADRLRVRKAQAHERAGEDVNANYYTDMAEARVEAERKREEFRKEATEEYMADLGGRIGDHGFEKMSRDELTLWGKIKAKVQSFFDKFLRGLNIAKNIRLTDKDLAYILFKSWQNLRKGRESSFHSERNADGIFAEAEDVAMRWRTGWNDEMLNESAKIEDANKRFNKELQQQIDGTLPESHIYELGNPGTILRSTGVPNLPIQMSATRLHRKASEFGHNFDLSEIRNLVKELQKPMAVFAYGDKGKMQNIIVGIESNGKQFIVGLSLNPIVNGKALEINSVRNVFPKNNAEWLNWISQGKMLYADKQKIQAIIDKQRTILADVDYLDLEDVAKILKTFENPTLEGDEDVKFRDGKDYVERNPVLARAIYEKQIQTSMYQFTEAMQDSMRGLMEFYKAVESQGVKRDVEDVSSFENAYTAENAMSSRSQEEWDRYEHRILHPLLDIAAHISANKRGEQELIDYLMAKHGLERNAYMRNEAMKNGEDTERDFAGLCGLTGEHNWQNAETTAQQMVDDYESAHSADIDKLWDAVNKATKTTLRKVYDCGLLGKEQYENIRDMYKYYIPLQGFDEKTSNDVYGYLTSKGGAFGSPIKKASGRKSKADDPFAAIAYMAQNSIIQGNRNLMKQKFLTYVQNHPSDLASVNRLWLMHDEITDTWKPVFADINEDMTPDGIDKAVMDFEQRMEALSQSEPNKYKRGKDAIGIPYRVVDGNIKEHQVLVKRNGEGYVITINGNPRAAQAINGLTNPDNDLNGAIGKVFSLANYVNRELSQLYTTRNPDFVVSNFIRDLIYSNMMVHIKENQGYAMRFHVNHAKVNPLMMIKLLHLYESDKLDMHKPVHRMFYEFMHWGGETGYVMQKNLDQEKKAVVKILKEARRGKINPISILGLIGNKLDLVNRSVENSARFAAFITSRERGRDIQRSVYDAKEISVNFNKKGAGSKFMDAKGQTMVGKAAGFTSSLGRSFYVFWNAAIQGTANFAKAFRKHPAKAIPTTTAVMLLGYVMAALMDDGDDEGNNGYYNLAKTTRRSNLNFRYGDLWITIPLPVEFRAFYGLGELAYGVTSGREEYSDAELAKETAAQLSQILPVDFMEGGGGLHAFIPSAFKPMVESATNTSWNGLPIYRDTPFNKDMPEWTKAYPRTNSQLVDLSKWANEASGGNDYKAGWANFNPAQLEYLMKGYFGGYANIADKMVKTGETMLGEREYDPSSILLVNRLVKKGDERTAEKKINSDFFRYYEEYKRTHTLLNKYKAEVERGSGKYNIFLDALEHSRDGARHNVMDEYASRYRKLNNAIKDPDTTDADRETFEEDMRRLKREVVALMKVAHDTSQVKMLQQQFAKESIKQ